MVTRIRTLIDSRQLTPTQFADTIGVARPIISHILSGRNKPSLEVVQRILAAMPGLSVSWLLNGTGPMQSPQTQADMGGGANLPVTAARLGHPGAAKKGESPAKQEPAAEMPSVAHAPANQLDAHPVRTTPPALPIFKRFAVRQSILNVSGGTPAPSLEAPIPASPGIEAAGQISSADAQPGLGKATILVSQPDKVFAWPDSQVVLPQIDFKQNPSVIARDNLGSADMPGTEPVNSDSGSNNQLIQSLPGSTKKIRRIVVFYQDGTFTDFLPE